MEKFFFLFVVVFMVACSDIGGQGSPLNITPVIEFDVETIEIEPVFNVTAGVDEPQLIAEYRVYSSEGEYFLERLSFELSSSCGEDEAECILFYDGLDEFQVSMDGHECLVEAMGFDGFLATCGQTVSAQEPSLIQVFSQVVDVSDEEVRGNISISGVLTFKDENTRDLAQSPSWNPSIGEQSGQTSAVIQTYRGFGINWRWTEVVIAP